MKALRTPKHASPASEDLQIGCYAKSQPATKADLSSDAEQRESASGQQITPASTLRVQTLIDALLHEINHILFLRRSKPTALIPYVSKFSVETLDLALLSHPNGYVRRFMAVIVGLVFEQNSDIFRTSVLNNYQDVYLRDKSLFLCKASPAIRNSRPEPLYHVEQAFFHYLPKGLYPRGQRCYLDEKKLAMILISKEYLRLPDPADHVVWLEFEDPIISFEILHDKSVEVRELSPEATDPHPSSAPFLSAKKKIDTRVKAISIFKPPTDLPTGSCQDLDSVPPTSGVHRIKCFQFFRKQKEQLESETSHANRHLKLWLPDDDAWPAPVIPRVSVNKKQPTRKSPQFESVNDKAFPKTFYSTQFKVSSVELANSPTKSHTNTSSDHPVTPESANPSAQVLSRFDNSDDTTIHQNFAAFAADWNQTSFGSQSAIKSPAKDLHRSVRVVGHVQNLRHQLQKAAFGPTTKPDSRSKTLDQIRVGESPNIRAGKIMFRGSSPKTPPSFVIGSKSPAVVKKLGDPSYKTSIPASGSRLLTPGKNAASKNSAFTLKTEIVGPLKNLRPGNSLELAKGVRRNNQRTRPESPSRI